MILGEYTHWVPTALQSWNFEAQGVKIGKFFELLKSLLLHGSQAPAAQIT
jgi:hypothetical protein